VARYGVLKGTIVSGSQFWGTGRGGGQWFVGKERKLRTDSSDQELASDRLVGLTKSSYKGKTWGGGNRGNRYVGDMEEWGVRMGGLGKRKSGRREGGFGGSGARVATGKDARGLKSARAGVLGGGRDRVMGGEGFVKFEKEWPKLIELE